MTNPTNDPSRRSFVEVAPDSHFPIQNLPYGVCRPRAGGSARCCTAIGDRIVDLAALESLGLLPDISEQPVFSVSSLNAFAALGRTAWSAVRRAVSDLLDVDNSVLRDNAEWQQQVFSEQSAVDMLLPMEVGDYTDFYSSKEHATNVGIMFRGVDNALQPNWLHLPVGYHGRASSVVVSGHPIRRPSGQKMPPDADTPVFGPSQAMDFELEMGFYIGPGTEVGQAVAADTAEDRIFGMSLVNDWSARDIQRWEYVPLGPFLGKNFATSVAPWIVSLEALEPFRCDGPEQSPAPLSYLGGNARHAFDVQLEVALTTAQMPARHVLSRSNFRYLYWSMTQQLAHHTCNGCNVNPGDLLASGTISGSTADSLGSMLELAWKGERPVALPSGESRKMLQDGDTVIMSGFAQGDGYRIGFGEVTGEITSA
ncbi:MAG: fumarylacetoacetase [Planctomycetaceae bacterium]|nr:fumarylacetoacetase [Planctomycetaceae bacterium]